MSATSQRAARRERQVARTLEVERIKGQRGKSCADVGLVRLPDGRRLQCEVKSRVCAPKWATSILEQARKYSRGSIPLGAIYARGSRDGIAVLYLADLCALLGIGELPTKPRRVKPDARQLELLAGVA